MKKLNICVFACLLALLALCTVLLISCGTESACANGHTPVTDAAVAATCTGRGFTEGSHCSVCNAVITAQTTTERLAHTAGEWQITLSPSCTQKGSRYRTCTVCETILETEEIPLLSHTFGAWTTTVAPTCSAGGLRACVCSICETVKTETIPATAHTVGDWITDVAVTCTTDGSQHKTCSICSATVAVRTVEAQGHSTSTPTVTTAATCTTNGLQTATCSVCEETVSTVIPATGHTLSTPTVVLAATCSVKGVQHRFCTVCEDSTPAAIEEIPALGHQHGTWATLSEATCTTPGCETSSCGRCGDTLRREIPATAHSAANWTVLLAATDGTAGMEKGSCPSCGTDLGTRYTNPLSPSVGFTYTTSAKGHTITGIGTCTDTDLVIPCYIDDLPVITINSLSSGAAVRSIFIPPTVTAVSRTIRSQSGLVQEEGGVLYVGQWAVGYTADLPAVPVLRNSTVGIATLAFQNAEVLTSISIPAGVKYICNSSFYNCTALNTVTFAENSECSSIGSNAFSYSPITAFRLPKSVTSLGTRLFDSCTELRSLTAQDGNPVYTAKGNALIELATKTLICGCKTTTIPAGGHVTAIAPYAFYRQSGLQRATLPVGVTSVGEYAFTMSGIVTLNLPASLSSIGTAAFGGLSKLSNLSLASGNTHYAVKNGCLVDLSAKSVLAATQSATIPTDLALTTIAAYAFSHHTQQTLTIPASISVIGIYAFSNSALTEISLPAISALSSHAFFNCPNLTSVTLAGTVSIVDSYAFASCSSLSSVTLPNSLTSINDSAFKNCVSLRAITLPSALKQIGQYAFQSTKLYAITIPANVTQIGANAFGNCFKLVQIRNLSGLSLPTTIMPQNSLRQILTDTTTSFSYSISSPDSAGFVTLKNGNIYYLFDYLGNGTLINLTGKGIQRIYNHALYNNTSIRQVILPAAVTTIGSYAFSGCSSLESVTLYAPSIGSYAFQGCTSLTTFSNTGGTLGPRAFRDCTALETVTVNCESIQAYAFQGCTALKSATLNITSIAAYAFTNCTALETLKVTAKTTNVVSTAFFNCTAIKTASLPLVCAECIPTNSLEKLTVINGEEIPAYFLTDCVTVREVILPSTLFTVREGAFSGCVSLKTATIPTTAIANFPKDYLESVTIISGTKYKYDKENKVFLIVSHSVVPTYAFKDDDVLKHVIIGEDITEIKGQAFYRCDALETCVFAKDRYDSMKIGGNTFCSAPKLWKLELPEGLTSIAGQLVYDCKALQSLRIPSTVTVIEYEAFKGSGITSITIPKSVVMLHNRVPDNNELGTFAECRSLKTVVFEAGSALTHISNYCFRNCTALESVTIPASVSTIGRGAFAGCTSLTSLTFSNPSNWKRIARSSCTSNQTGFTTSVSGTATALSSPTGSNITYLTSTYKDYYWKRS